MAAKLSELKALLYRHYSQDPSAVFKNFRNGAIAFAGGLFMIFYAHSQLPPSLAQELVVLAGLVLGGVGFIIAMLAHIRLIIGRFVRFFSH